MKPTNTTQPTANSYVDSSSSSVADGDADNSSSSFGGGDESDNGGVTVDSVANLPSFSPVANPTFMWGSLSADVFTSTLDSIYSKVVHWRRNAFVVPYGRLAPPLSVSCRDFSVHSPLLLL